MACQIMNVRKHSSDRYSGKSTVSWRSFCLLLSDTFQFKTCYFSRHSLSIVANVTLNFKLSFFDVWIVFSKQPILSRLITTNPLNNIYGTSCNVNKQKTPVKLVCIDFTQIISIKFKREHGVAV